MNKRSVKKARPAKASARTAVRKAPVRKSSARQAVRKPEASSIVNMTTVTVAEVVARAPSALRSQHKYRVGQTVFYTSSPISRPGATGSCQVVRLLPSTANRSSESPWVSVGSADETPTRNDCCWKIPIEARFVRSAIPAN